jgi:murein L,D-transpeptidase YafK
MSFDSLAKFAAMRRGVLLALGVGVLLAGCAQVEVPPHLRPLSRESMMLLGKKELRPDAPLFVRVFKEESELEVWKQRPDGRFEHFKTYPICNWSGELGPKIKQGDRQAPEGFYTVSRHQMNPNSQFHLAFNLGYPNALDRAHGRSGDFLMVHGKCKSAGCYAMTDGLMEEIYALAREAFIGGQESIHVHAFPFRMTDENMARHANHPALPFWKHLKDGYDDFEATRVPPFVAVCSKRYVVNPRWRNGIVPAKLDAEQACPAFERDPPPFSPRPQVAEQRIIVHGPKTRTAANIGTGVPYATLEEPARPAGMMSLGAPVMSWREDATTTPPAPTVMPEPEPALVPPAPSPATRAAEAAAVPVLLAPPRLVR